MNIYYLDSIPGLAARYHADRHVSKMILETIQILKRCHLGTPLQAQLNDSLVSDDRADYDRHPCVVWASASRHNYAWLLALLDNLLVQYELRGNSPHPFAGASRLLATFPKGIADVPFTQPPQCVPDRYKSADAVHSYREYYVCEKRHLAKWSAPSHVPMWWVQLSKLRGFI